MSNSSISTRGHAYKLFQSLNHLDSRKHFFAEQIIKPWNILPANNYTFKSLANFKSYVNSVNLINIVSLVTNKKQRQSSTSLLTLGLLYPAHWLRCHAVRQHLTFVVDCRRSPVDSAMRRPRS